MASTVFILGAGASKRAGVPLMSEFLDEADRLWKTGEVREAEESFATVFRARGVLQRVHSKAQLDLHNVESVFAAFEMARTLSKFGDYGPEELANIVGAMRVVIVQTIERSLHYPVRDRQILPPEPYAKLAALIRMLREDARPKHTVAIITFNYDLAAEYSLRFTQLPIDYGLGAEGCEADGAVPVLKLHGSINWGWCKECSRVVPWMLRDYLASMSEGIFSETEAIRMPVGSQLASAHGHGHPLVGEPVLVPPTWNKSQYSRNLDAVWSRAASELAEAEEIFMLGYSMPPSDEFFKYLYALGTVSEVPLKKFWVFNPDDGPGIRKRYENLLGPGAKQRRDYKVQTFSEALEYLESCFKPQAREKKK